MKKYLVILVLALVVGLAGCTESPDVTCGAGTQYKDGQCVAPIDDEPTECEVGETLVDGECVEDNEVVECTTGQTLVDGACVNDEPTECTGGKTLVDGACVFLPVETPDWFDGWYLLTEPVGNLSLRDFTFTETGFSVYLDGSSRVGIQLKYLELDPGFSYEVKFDYSSDVAGQGLFVQLEGHGGNFFINPGIITNGTNEVFSQTLAFSPEAVATTDGFLTIEFFATGVVGEMAVDNIEIIKTALPVCGDNEKLSGTECVADNNGFIPNGTPTAWFDDWALLQGGDKEINDYEFSETGFTAYLDVSERTGIEYMGYVFESGYTYELSFDYTAGVAGRMIWVQMEALGGYGFTNTDFWTVSGSGTFTQSLVIPSTYVPTETGWIKIELTPGPLDNVTIENIVITKTAN